MKYRFGVILFLLLSSLFSIAWKNAEHIDGEVRDVFGKPLADVTVKVEKSRFEAMTDSSGNFSLDYAPGKFSLVFFKKGYTTRKLSLDISQKVYFPVETMVLYPIPQQEGVFYVGPERLTKLTEGSVIMRKNTVEKKTFYQKTRYRFFSKYAGLPPIIQPGRITFIDRVPKNLSLAKADDKWVIFETMVDVLIPRDEYKRVEEVTDKIGEEKLLVRTVLLKPGNYLSFRKIVL